MAGAAAIQSPSIPKTVRDARALGVILLEMLTKKNFQRVSLLGDESERNESFLNRATSLKERRETKSSMYEEIKKAAVENGVIEGSDEKEIATLNQVVDIVLGCVESNLHNRYSTEEALEKFKNL